MAVYYLVTQNPWVKPYWDHLFPLVWLVCLHLSGHGHQSLNPVHMVQWGWWVTLRHVLFRGALEGIYGGTALKLLLTNPMKKYRYGIPDRWDRVMLFLRLPNRFQNRPASGTQYALSPVTILVACAPGLAAGSLVFFGGPLLLHGAHVFLTVHGLGMLHGTSFWTRYQNLWRTDWSSKALGLPGFFFYGNRMIAKLGGDLLRNMTSRKAYLFQAVPGPVARWLFGRPRWFYPPVYKQMWKAAIQVPQEKHGNITRLVTMCAAPAVIAAAVYGTTILLAAKG